MKINKNTTLIALLLLTLFYFILRLLSLITIPFFGDEADYIYFSKIILSHPYQGLISLSVGVKPLFIWLMVPFLAISNGHDLFAARMVPLATGFLTMLGLYFLTMELFKKRDVAILSCIIFILFPYAQIYNVVSVLEGTVGMFIVYSLLFSIKLFKHPTLSKTYTFALVTGLGILTKRQAFFNLYLLPLSFLFYKFDNKHRQKLLYIFALISFSVIIIGLLQLILHLSPFFERIAWYEGGTLYTKRAWLVLPLIIKFTIFQNNFFKIITSLFSYFTFIYVILFFASFSLKKYWKAVLILTGYFIIPVLITATFAMYINERWIYPLTLTTIPLIAISLYVLGQKVKNKWRNILYFLIFLYPAIYILMIIFFPLNSPLPLAEKNQYFVCPMSLFDKNFSYLNKVSKNQKILVGTDSTLNFKNYLTIMLQNNKNITLKTKLRNNPTNLLTKLT